MKQMTFAATKKFEVHGRSPPPLKAEFLARMQALVPWAVLCALIQANGIKLSGGTIVDATLIAAPPSAKNREQCRDPEMHQSKKGNQCH